MAANWNLNQVLNQLDSGSHWSGSQISYSFPSSTINMVTSGGEAGGFSQLSASQITFAEYALASWDDLIAPSFFEGTGKTNIEIGNTTTGIDYAHAYYPNQGSVWFNPSFGELANVVIGEYGYGTFIHEIGHAIGLDHMGDYNGSGNWTPSSFQDTTVLSIMSYFGPDQGSDDGKNEVMWADWVKGGTTYAAQTPMLNDIMAVQAIYGADTTTRTGGTVYGFNSNVTGTAANFFDFSVNENPVLCIYDAGGTDTLDLSGFSTSSTISLVAGTFSDCNQMTSNISIAYTATIENAIGGTANDTITGNNAVNLLQGGRGNDTITGGGGNDIAVFAGMFANYTIVSNGTGGYTVTDNVGTDGTDTLTSIEILRFSDRDVADGGSSTTAPVLASALVDQDAALDTIFTFTVPSGAFTDPNGDALTYSATLTGGGALPSWLSFNATTRTFAGTPDSGDVATLSIVVTASDGTETASDTFEIDVGGGSADVFGTIAIDDLVGNDASQTFWALGSNDTVQAGGGNDTIYGGAGGDRLWGKAGADTFAYNRVGESQYRNDKFDIIKDFDIAEGDMIDLSGVDANIRGGKQAFRFAGDGDGWAKRGQFDYLIDGDTTYIYGYTDRDRNPDFFIQIDGAVALTAANFIL